LEPTLKPDRTIDEGRSASYRMETLDAAAETERLRIQVELVRDLEDGFLAEAGLPRDGRVLDVGCGPGFFSERIARELLSAEAAVIGVDVDASLIELGRVRLADSGLPVEFRLGTAVRLPLEDDAVDFSYARFLFQHVSDPRSVLDEMIRVTRPGGTVAVVDTDDGGLVVHPEPAGFGAFLAASRAAQRDRGGDRHVGRKLLSMLTEAGLSEPAVSVRPLTTGHLAPAHFVAITLGFKTGVIGPPYIEREAALTTEAELRAFAAEPGFFGHALGYGAWGRVP